MNITSLNAYAASPGLPFASLTEASTDAVTPPSNVGLAPPQLAAIVEAMSFQFVVQRDLDGTWSVRQRATNVPVTIRGKTLSGLTEKAAAQHAKRLNTMTTPAPLALRLQG